MLALVASPLSEEHVELREVPEPSPASNETVVDVRAISINRGEVHRLAGAEDGARLGWDIAGVVAQPAADGGGPVPGQRVVGFLVGGGWAQRVAVPNLRLAVLPDEVSFAAASTLPVAGITALRMLRLGGLLLGKRVLVTGATGGVGCYVVQLAARSGAHVTGVASSGARGEGLRELGAHEIIVGLEAATQPFHLILESVGGSSLGRALELINPGGVVVAFGNSARETTTFNVSSFYNRNSATLHAFSLLSPTQPQDFRPDLSYLASCLASGEVDAQIGLEVSWREASRALATLRDRRVQGKAVLHVD